MRDAKVYQIWEGTAEIQRLIISAASSASVSPRAAGSAGRGRSPTVSAG